MPDTMLEHALAYLKLGWSIIPLEPEEKKALIKWERYQKNKPTENEVRRWWKKYPNANIGIITGRVSNLIVIDLETITSKEVYLANFGDIHSTISQTTGKPKGLHLFFKHPGDRNYQNFVRIWTDTDIRADGGYVVAAPSVHPNGTRYAWQIDPIEMGLDDLLDLPIDIKKKLVDAMEKGVSRQRSDEGWVQELLMGVNEGKRNDSCARLAGYYIRIFDGNIDQVLAILQDWNHRNNPPLDWKEIQTIVESIAKREGREELGEAVGATIEKIQILKYPAPDSTRVYRVFIKDHQDCVEMNMGELLTFPRFKVKFAELTKKIPRKVSQVTWDKRVEKALGEAEEINVSTDETSMGLVIRLINFQLRDSNQMNDITLIDNRIVVNGSEIYLKIETILDALAAEKEKISRKEVGRILRAMDFVYERIRVKSFQLRVWHRPLDDEYKQLYMD